MVWEENNLTGPVLLANSTNNAILEHAEDLDSPTETEQRAISASARGGARLCWIAGQLFNNSDDKLGQQDIHLLFCKHKGEPVRKFPDTSNTHYQSYSAAATELLICRDFYLDFIKWIELAKDHPQLSNMEKNLQKGLSDNPTLHELAVYALYAQAITHPYMRQIQGPGTETGEHCLNLALCTERFSNTWRK